MLNDAPGTCRYRHGPFVNRSQGGHRRFPPRSRSRDREQERADLSSAASNLPAGTSDTQAEGDGGHDILAGYLQRPSPHRQHRSTHHRPDAGLDVGMDGVQEVFDGMPWG